jgi:hypothetical protein
LCRKLENIGIVGLEPILGSGGICFDFLGSDKHALAAALSFRYFWLTNMVNCLLTQLQPQWVVIEIDA